MAKAMMVNSVRRMLLQGVRTRFEAGHTIVAAASLRLRPLADLTTRVCSCSSDSFSSSFQLLQTCTASTTSAAADDGSSPHSTTSSSSARTKSKLLSTAVLRSIKADLIEADANDDQRVDFDDIKSILAKYSDAFTKEDAEAIGEIFYVGMGGKSISHRRFLRAVQHSANDGSAETSPLGLESVKDDRCFLSPGHYSTYYNTAAEFDRHLKRYIEEIVARNDAGE